MTLCVSMFHGMRCELPARHSEAEHEARHEGRRVKWSDADAAQVFAAKPSKLCEACGKAFRCRPCGGQGELLAPLQARATEAPAAPAVDVEVRVHEPRAAAVPPAEASASLAASTVVGQLDEQLQRELAAQVAELWRHAPPLHPRAIGGTLMRVKVTNAGELGWWGDGKAYSYVSRHPGGYPWPPIPEAWLALWRRFSPRPDLRPDGAVVNWYDAADAKMSLGWHADTSERDTTLPIVTISLGDPASWAVRESEGAPVSRCRLESGAVTLLAGPTRLLEHTIERLLPPVQQVGLGLDVPPFVPFASPLPKRGRVSITMRVAGDPRAAASAAAQPRVLPPPAVDYGTARGFLEELGRLTGRGGEARRYG